MDHLLSILWSILDLHVELYYNYLLMQHVRLIFTHNIFALLIYSTHQIKFFLWNIFDSHLYEIAKFVSYQYSCWIYLIFFHFFELLDFFKFLFSIPNFLHLYGDLLFQFFYIFSSYPLERLMPLLGMIQLFLCSLD